MATQFKVNDQVKVKPSVAQSYVKRFIGMPGQISEIKIGEQETTFILTFYPSIADGLTMSLSYDEMMMYMDKIEADKSRLVPQSLSAWYNQTLSVLSKV